MKVLLVYTNRYRFMAPPPIGLATLVRPLADAGHEVRLLDLLFAKKAMQALERSLRDFRPDVVGFSIRNVDEQDMSRESTTLGDIRPMIQMAAAQGRRTVLGGPAFSTFPAEMLVYMGADVGLAGQAEGTLPRLVVSLHGTLDTSLPGLVWREGDRIRANPPLLPGYVGVCPDWSSFDHRPYRRSMFQAAVVIRSGCAHRCAYCDVPRVFGDRFVRRDTESILDDIRRLRDEHSIRVVFLTGRIPCLTLRSRLRGGVKPSSLVLRGGCRDLDATRGLRLDGGVLQCWRREVHAGPEPGNING